MKDGAYDENEWALTGSVDDMIARVDGLRGNVTKDRLDEGIVWHLNLPCGSYGYESEAVDAWLDELAEKLGKRELF